MFEIKFTKGDTEIIILQVDSLEKAKEKAIQFRNDPKYAGGLITVEKDGRIY